MKKSFFKRILSAVLFLLIFLPIFTAATLIYYPKWTPMQDKGQVQGFYLEPKNTIDVLFLGSCNMYSSISPALLYERNGITSYGLTCPDQEMSTTYYFIKDALKTQKPKVVVVEALFLMQRNSENRERYNRFALDYMPMSWNKICLAWETAKTESDIMHQFDKNAASRAMSFAGYLFPLLRYHGRTDFVPEDLTYFITADKSNFYKGGVPHYDYTNNDGNYLLKVFNGPSINRTAKKFFPMIKQLCDENGIQLVVMKSPNYARWGHDDKYTSIARDYVTSFGVPFVDMHSREFNHFEDYDYGADVNLNLYGARKVTYEMADYLIREFDLQPTSLSLKNAVAWENCVEKLHNRALEKGFDIEPGHLAQLFNKEDAVCVRWNPSEDCSKYSIYRMKGHSGAAEKLATVSGETYDDKDVEHAKGYTYYVVPEEGELAGTKSNTEYTVFVKMPTNVKGFNYDGKIKLTWDGESDCYFRLYRRYCAGLKLKSWARTSKHSYVNAKSITQGKCYTFRVSAVIKENDIEYQSESINVTILPQSTPVVKNTVNENGQIVISWEEMQNREKINIYRAVGNSTEYELYRTIEGTKTSYTDTNVEEGVQYSYKVSTIAECYGITEESALSDPVTVLAK